MKKASNSTKTITNIPSNTNGFLNKLIESISPFYHPYIYRGLLLLFVLGIFLGVLLSNIYLVYVFGVLAMLLMFDFLFVSLYSYIMFLKINMKKE